MSTIVMMTESELAERWRTTPRTMRKRRAEGKCCPHVMVGGHPRYRVEDVLAFEVNSLVGQPIPANVLQDMQRAAGVLDIVAGWKMREESLATVLSARDALRRHIPKK
jgi:hypothetical protein